MMLGGEHHIAHASQVCECGPVFRVELAGIEGLEQFGKEAVGVVARSADEGMADDDAELAIEAPMDEESEALVAEPVEAVGLVERADLRIGFFLCEKEWDEEYRSKKSEGAEHGEAHRSLDLLRTITGFEKTIQEGVGVRLPSDNREVRWSFRDYQGGR